MSNRLLHALLAGMLMSGIPLQGCVQMPTEKAGIVDVRPQISFRLIDDSVRPARVIIDGIDMGAVADFIDGVATLRVLPGTHALRVTFMGLAILDEKFYLGDGTQRTFTVSKGY